jgi:hypothetical protein
MSSPALPHVPAMPAAATILREQVGRHRITVTDRVGAQSRQTQQGDRRIGALHESHDATPIIRKAPSVKAQRRALITLSRRVSEGSGNQAAKQQPKSAARMGSGKQRDVLQIHVADTAQVAAARNERAHVGSARKRGTAIPQRCAAGDLTGEGVSHRPADTSPARGMLLSRRAHDAGGES